jgi:hypothetical protein
MRNVLWSFLSLSLLATPALAQGTAPATAPSIELGGLVDVYYDFYSTKPSGDAPYRNFDTKHNQFALSMAEVWLAKAPTADSRAGFKLKLNFGPATTSFVHAAEPGGAQVFQHVQEAYASYLAPAGKGLQIDAGIFVTQHGAEVIEAKDNWNYSRSLLFALAIPYYHAGVRFMYPVNDKVTLMGDIVNGWNNVVENNTGKTVGGQIIYKPSGKVSIIQNYMAGPEQAGNDDDWRQLSDTTVTYAATDALSVMANYDYGHDTFGGNKAHWQGIGGYVKYQANDRVAISPRFEYYDDASGATTGAVQKLKDATFTIEVKGADNFLWRIEYRGDSSDRPVFTNRAGTAKKNQQSIGFGVLYSFSSKVQ